MGWVGCLKVRVIWSHSEFHVAGGGPPGIVYKVLWVAKITPGQRNEDRKKHQPSSTPTAIINLKSKEEGLPVASTEANFQRNRV